MASNAIPVRVIEQEGANGEEAKAALKDDARTRT